MRAETISTISSCSRDSEAVDGLSSDTTYSDSGDEIPVAVAAEGRRLSLIVELDVEGLLPAEGRCFPALSAAKVRSYGLGMDEAGEDLQCSERVGESGLSRDGVSVETLLREEPCTKVGLRDTRPSSVVIALSRFPMMEEASTSRVRARLCNSPMSPESVREDIWVIMKNVALCSCKDRIVSVRVRESNRPFVWANSVPSSHWSTCCSISMPCRNLIMDDRRATIF